MIFVFEIHNMLDHTLKFGLPGAGPEWKSPMLSGEKRKLRATEDQLQEWLPYLEGAVEKNQIDIVLKTELILLRDFGAERTGKMPVTPYSE